MRGALVLLVLLAPTAAAATTIEIETPAPIAPLQGVVTTPVRVTVDCEPALPGREAAKLELKVLEAPGWASIVVSPPVHAIDCPAGPKTFESELSLTATQDAPAFSPTMLTIHASVAGGALPDNKSASGSTSIQASFFPLLDVTIDSNTIAMRPGETQDVRLTLTNFGNADTRVDVLLVDASGDLVLVMPDPFTLQSRQMGGAETSRDVFVKVTTPASGGFVNRVDVVNLRVASAYAIDPTMRGDEASTSFVVTTKSFATPHALIAPMTALALAALLRRR